MSGTHLCGTWLLAIPPMNLQLPLVWLLDLELVPGLRVTTIWLNRLELLARPPRAHLRPVIGMAIALWQVIRGPLMPVLIWNLWCTWLMSILRRSLFTFVTTARLALLLERIRNAGLLLVSCRTVAVSPLRLFPAPGLTVILTIGVGNATDLSMTGPVGLYRALLAAALPRFTIVMTLLVFIDVTLLCPPVRTWQTPLTCLPWLPMSPSIRALAPRILEQTWTQASPFRRGLSVTPNVSVEKGLLLPGPCLTIMDLLLGPRLATVVMLSGAGRQVIIVLSTGRMFPPPNVALASIGASPLLRAVCWTLVRSRVLEGLLFLRHTRTTLLLVLVSALTSPLWHLVVPLARLVGTLLRMQLLLTRALLCYTTVPT